MIARIPSSNTLDTFRLDNAFSPVLLGFKVQFHLIALHWFQGKGHSLSGLDLSKKG